MKTYLASIAAVSMLAVGLVGTRAIASEGQSSRGADPASATGKMAPSRPDLSTMVASASYSSGRDGMLISNDMEQWGQKRFELDLVNEAESGWSSSPDDYRDYRSTDTTSRRRSTAPSSSTSSDQGDVAPAAKLTKDESSESLLASVPPWVKYSIVAAPTLLGLLGFGAYMFARRRFQSQQARRSREPALLVGLVDAQEHVRPATLARIGQRQAAETAPLPELEAENNQRRAA